MSEPLNAGIKRIIWVATDKKHRIVDTWCNSSVCSLSTWKKSWKGWNVYITKHEIWV